jgi:Na+:H+ antiporter, NhaA family
MSLPSTATRSFRRVAPLRDFLHAEAASGVLLVAAAVAALVWANSPWSGSYEDVWSSRFALSFEGRALDLDLRHWVNDGLMAVFFLVVGLEIKREVCDGHLSTRRTAMMPVAAALGGMIVPALMYLAIAGGTAPRGWAVPMATDIALAIGMLAVAGAALAPSLRAFLLGLAIVDDIGAIVVIAIVYSSGVSWPWFAMAVLAVVVTVAAQRLGVAAMPAYVGLGAVLWFALHEAGVHATLAGVVMGVLAPTTPRLNRELVDDEQLSDLSDVDAARATASTARDSVSVVEWLEHVLHPWTSFVIVPLFSLANAGIAIDADRLGDAVTSPIMWGIVAGLAVGKPVGVLVASRLAARSGLADAPHGADPRHTVGVGAAAGIGFTVALFITELAFDDVDEREIAKMAVLLASLLAAVFAATFLRARPSRVTAEDA